MNCCGDPKAQKAEGVGDLDEMSPHKSHISKEGNPHAHSGCGVCGGYMFWFLLALIVGFILIEYIV